jgi:hypothetical protein
MRTSVATSEVKPFSPAAAMSGIGVEGAAPQPHALGQNSLIDGALISEPSALIGPSGVNWNSIKPRLSRWQLLQELVCLVSVGHV